MTMCISVQCRKFKGSEAVRSQAAVIYDKFKTMFLLPADVDNSHEVLCIYIFISSTDNFNDQ